ncbi:hypothetical protein ACF061_12660 [Streptomyces sp. NPDC015220]|uniref:hypothetical protein n=1 Tax=Streptomyces sp. NPDC015220 TaxID=3364947 RepID=UPI0036FB04D6
MNAATSERSGGRAVPSPASLAARAMGAAGTGAALTYLSFELVDWADRYDTRTCARAPDFCMTLWPIISIPGSFAIALVVLIVVYRPLGIRPQLAVIPPTLLLAPFPLVAAWTAVGLWTAVLVGAVWAAALALTVWRPCRIPGLSVSAALLLASLVILHR